MAQVIRITSEALQATIRRLLPSQQGFGEDLQASNVILPVIDVTPTAEGSVLRQDLQTAIDDSMTYVSVSGSTATVISATGFIEVNYAAVNNDATVAKPVTFQINDGLSTQTALTQFIPIGTGGISNGQKLVFYVPSGSTLEVVSSASTNVQTTARQIADVNGNTVNPSGFTSE